MRLAFPLLLTLLGAAAMTAAFAACSSSDDTGATDTNDSGTDGTTGGDAKNDVVPSDGGGVKEGGNCSVVKGACDIVLQNCPDDSKGQKQECVVSQTDKTLTTKCIAVQSSQTLPQGHSCCPGSANPCLPGLTCVGSPCVDGGPVTGRCSPACCKGDDQACGLSDPEGIQGTCDITLFSGDTELHDVCSYRQRCKPFGQEPCKAGDLCIIEDKLGTAGCINSFEKALGESCKFSNDCADGLFCFSPLQDGGDPKCRMICLTPNSTHPFDASVEEGGPLKGGCNPSEQCSITNFQDLPAWFSLCTLDGG